MGLISGKARELSVGSLVVFAISGACSVNRDGPGGGNGGAQGGSSMAARGGNVGSGSQNKGGVAGTSSMGGSGSAAGGSTSAQGGTADAGFAGVTMDGEGGALASDGGHGGVAGSGGMVEAGGTANGQGGVAGSGIANGGAVTNGGAPSAGGGTGGKASGGAPDAGGGALNGGASSGGGTGSGGSCSTGLLMCSGKCIDPATNKAHCGACGTACEGYQFCAMSKCLPQYQNTRVQPLTSGSQGIVVRSGGVLTNKPQGDLILQLDGDATLSAPGALMTAELHGSGYARYTTGGVLVWSRSSKQIFTDNFQVLTETPIALMPNGDFAVAYQKYDPPTGPVAGTYAYRLARVGGSNGNLVWEAKYPTTATKPSVVVPRSAKSDFFTFNYCLTYQLTGDVYRIIDAGTSGTLTKLAPSYAMGAAASADGSTAWIWGQYAATGSWQLNPLSTQTWPITPNAGQAGGDAYLLGAQDGATVGPWFTEGDSGVVMLMAVDSAGDLVVAAYSDGYAPFNGDQDFFTTNAPGKILAKISRTNGKVLWRTTLASNPWSIIIAPGDRIVTVDQEGDATTPYTLSIHSGADGALLSRVSTGQNPSGDLVVAAGLTEMFVVGQVSTAADFHPGAAVDSHGASPGLFVSRFAF
ncbi:MAG: hypothetical protein ACOY0T_18795 [Myxococcota bacterium]